jgi:hypothetical protein
MEHIHPILKIVFHFLRNVCTGKSKEYTSDLVYSRNRKERIGKIENKKLEYEEGLW